MEKPLLTLINVNKYFGNSHILRDVSFDIKDGEFLTILGPSGCGKTTILRCIAGLETIDSGDILLNEKSIKELAPNKRNVNTVFQNYALFPHLNVYDNVAYGPRIKKSMKEEGLKEEIGKVLDLVKMIGYEKRMPNQLSGGQRQRIAIARALINKPDMLLLDEPLGALDLKLRKHMQTELANLQRQTKTTFVYVTHDQEEALNMSDRIVVMHKGRIQQLGSPRDVYNYPKNLFVTNFIGDRNIIEVEVLEKEGEYHRVKLGQNTIKIKCSKNVECDKKPGDKAILAIHMDKMRVACDKMDNTLAGDVASVHYSGSQIRTQVNIDGERLIVISYQNNDCDYEIGDRVYISWEESGAILLPKEEDTKGSDD